MPGADKYIKTVKQMLEWPMTLWPAVGKKASRQLPTMIAVIILMVKVSAAVHWSGMCLGHLKCIFSSCKFLQQDA